MYLYILLYTQYVVNETSIFDTPRYGYRGLMIDTARHFYPVNTIIKILVSLEELQ